MAPGQTTIRPVRPDEHAALGELTVRVYRAVLDSPLESYSPVLRDVAGRLADGCDVLVAHHRGRLAGGVTYVSRSGPLAQLIAEDEAELRMLVVDPAFQGLGVGAALVQACLERATAAAKRALVLGTMPEMVTAHRLYERLGFHRTPERDRRLDSGHHLMSFEQVLAVDG